MGKGAPAPSDIFRQSCSIFRQNEEGVGQKQGKINPPTSPKATCQTAAGNSAQKSGHPNTPPSQPPARRNCTRGFSISGGLLRAALPVHTAPAKAR